MPSNVIFLGLLALMLSIFAFKIRHLLTRRKSPRLWAVCAVLITACGGLWAAAPVTQAWLASVTGVPNIGVPVLVTVLSAEGGSYLAVALLWRYPDGEAWRRLRWILGAYALAVVIMIALFASAHVPKTLPSTFIYEYANEPAAAAMVMLWLVTQMAGAILLASWCLTWARSGDYDELPWLRRGLRMYGAFGVCVIVFCLGMITPLVAAWFGVDSLKPIGIAFPPLTVPPTMLSLLAALVLPVWGPRLSAFGTWSSQWRAFFLLRTLHRSLNHITPEVIMVSEGKRLDPHHRVRRMLIELNDLHLTLSPHFDPAIVRAVEQQGPRAGLHGEKLAATVNAAQLAAASDAWRNGTLTDGKGAANRTDEDACDDGDLDTELAWWVQTSRAYRKSPIVANARTLAAPSPTAPTSTRTA